VVCDQRWAGTPSHRRLGAHGEFVSECPGYCGAQDTFYVGNMKGVGRIYQQTFIDTYAKVAFAKLYDRKNADHRGRSPQRLQCSSMMPARRRHAWAPQRLAHTSPPRSRSSQPPPTDGSSARCARYRKRPAGGFLKILARRALRSNSGNLAMSMPLTSSKSKAK
jgi:hypothetical protein